jgi:hypothetical protein
MNRLWAVPPLASPQLRRTLTQVGNATETGPPGGAP